MLLGFRILDLVEISNVNFLNPGCTLWDFVQVHVIGIIVKFGPCGASSSYMIELMLRFFFSGRRLDDPNRRLQCFCFSVLFVFPIDCHKFHLSRADLFL